jgi:hypothetical protein
LLDRAPIPIQNPFRRLNTKSKQKAINSTMNKIIIKTQAEWDALPKSFEEFTHIYIESVPDFWLSVNNKIGNARVVARESSHVEAWGSSHVEAWGSSHVVASNEVAIHNHSASTVIEIAGYAVIFALKIAKFIKKSETSTIINLPPRQYSVEEWNERENTDKNEDKIILYKKVSSDWKTQEGEKNETVWLVGSVMSHPSWNPSEEECGEGKFHACSRAYFCDEFRDKPNDRYIAIEVDPSDMFTWSEPSYPHKAAFKAGKVLYECDRYGKKING